MTMKPLNLAPARLLTLSVALLSMTACASVQPNARIADAQGRLTAAYNDKETMERGQGALASAKLALQSAEADWQHRDTEKSDHNLMMGNTYLDIAQTRGRQAKLEQENVRLANGARLAQKDQQLAAREQIIAQQGSQLEGKDRQISARDQVISGKDSQLAEAQAQLQDYHMKLNNLGSTMVLQDVSFETGKSQLLPGGVNRLSSLINYLRLSPKTQVHIEGYTDNVGGAEFNQQLSLDRANAVKAILTDAGVTAERISTTGSGLTKPVATNATIAGRQANRRVEITLLKQPAA